MKKTYVISATLLLFGLSTAAYAAPTVYFDFDGNGLQDSTWAVGVGDSFTANLYASGFEDMSVPPLDHNGLISFGLEVTYNPAMVTAGAPAVEASWAPILPPMPLGNVSFGGYLPLDPINIPTSGLSATSPRLLGSIAFSNSMEGDIQLSTADYLVFGGPSWIAFDQFIFDPLIDFQGATVTATVPLPGAAWLLGAGLTSLLGLRSRIKKTA